jgi:cysteine synthase A
MKTAETTSTGLRIAENITELVGLTPMLHLRRLSPEGGAQIYAKLEYLNPGGSVKDRAAIGIIRKAEQEGKLREGSTIVEATAGNTGIGLALIGVNRGYRVIFCVPEHFSAEKVKVMTALGAEVLRTPEKDGMQGAINKAKEIAAGIKDSFVALQFENQANPEYHFETTGQEILDQMDGRLDAIVIGIGTGGTFSGVARAIKKVQPNAKAVAVETEGSVLQGGAPGPHKVEGIGVSFIPKTYDPTVADEVIMVSDPDAFDMVKQLARREGVLAGSSGGANVFAAVQVAKRMSPDKRVVTVIPDSAERYLSKNIFEGGK